MNIIMPSYQHPTKLVYGLIENDIEFSSAVSNLLLTRKDTEVVYQFTSGEKHYALTYYLKINFLFVDYRLNGMDGICFLSQKKSKELKIPKLILSGFNAEEKNF